ncbi:MAG: hypothetical protein K1X74_10990 [Pirellulales bacterium]|nr:hypothetical protein [Pirellulales bacterium]
MAETSFFLDDADEDRVIRFVLSIGCWIVRNFSDCDRPAEIRDWDAYIKHRERGELLFVLHDSYFRHPFTLTRISAGYYAGQFAMPQRVDGPTIDISWARPYMQDGVRWISQGSISYYSSFWVTGSDIPEQAPGELVQIYKNIVREIKRGAKCVRSTQVRRRYWIGTAAREAMKAGSRLNIEGLVDV